VDRPHSHAFLLLGLFASLQLAACHSSAGLVPSTLQVTTGTLPNGTVGVPYSVTPMAMGGIPPYTWSIVALNPVLPPGLTFDGNVLSGTPKTAGNFGPYNFGVTDSQGNFAISVNLYLAIGTASSSESCVPRGNEAQLTSPSPHAFLVKGIDGGGNPIDIAGSFTPDGHGGIANAAVDYNGMTNGFEHLLVDLSASSYGFDSSAHGCLHLVFAGPATQSNGGSPPRAESRFSPADVTRARKIKAPAVPASIGSSVQFQFSLSGYDGVVYHTGRIIESDGANGNGSTVSGFVHVQTPSAFELAALQPNYAFGVDGWTPTARGVLRTALAGSFMNRSGNLSAGYADLNAGGVVSGELSDGYGALSSTIDTTTGRGTGSFSIATPSGDLSFDFVFYVLNGSDLILLSGDSAMGNSTAPLLAGRALAAATTYSSASLSGYYLLASQGLVVSGSTIGNVATIGTMNATGNGVIPTATMYSNLAATYASNRYSNNHYIVEAASGRASLMGVTPTPPVMYLTSANADGEVAGFLVGTDTEASSGEILRQSAIFPNYMLANVSGDFVMSEAESVDGLNDAFLTSLTFTGNGGYTLPSQPARPTIRLPHLGTISIRADGSGSLDDGRFALVTNGTALFAIPESRDPSLLVFDEYASPK
jgi:hypothetical protein